jgi:uridine kinase
MQSQIVAIAGPSGSGKTAVARGLVEAVGPDRAVRLSLDAYYKDLTGLDATLRERKNFDSPESIDWERYRQDLDALREGDGIAAPQYDFATHTRREETTPIPPRPFIVLDGLWVLEHAMTGLYTLRVYIDTPCGVCLDRRIERDLVERGRSRESVEHQWRETVWPMAEAFVLPERVRADLVLDGTQPVEKSVALILEQLKHQA